MAQLYDPSERWRSGLNTLAQSFIAGMQAKQQREQADREFQFKQEQALAEADRAERIAKLQEQQLGLQQFLALQKGVQEQSLLPGPADVVGRKVAPQFYPDIISQKPVSDILPTQELPVARPPARAPQTDEQRQTAQQLAVINDRLNRIETLPVPDNIKENLRGYLTEQAQQLQDALQPVSEVKTLPTAPRGGVFGQPLQIRPAGTVEQRTPAPSLFQAPPVKPLKPEADPLVQAQKEVELNFRSGRMSPDEMQKYYSLKSTYLQTGDKEAFARGLQGLRFREKPVREAAGTGTAEQRAKFNLLLGYQDVVHKTEQDNDRIEDNKRAKQKELSDLQAKLTALDNTLANGFIGQNEYNKQKAGLEKDISRANDEARSLDLKTIKNLERAAQITKSINQLEKEVGLPGQLETNQTEEETIKVDY